MREREKDMYIYILDSHRRRSAALGPGPRGPGPRAMGPGPRGQGPGHIAFSGFPPFRSRVQRQTYLLIYMLMFIHSYLLYGRLLVMKMLGLKVRYFFSGIIKWKTWNVFDFAIVMFSIVGPSEGLCGKYYSCSRPFKCGGSIRK